MLALAAAAAAGGLLAGGAPAEPARTEAPTLRGELESGGRVGFELARKQSGERRIVRWRWRNLPIECANGAQKLDGDFNRPWLEVTQKRAFHGRAEPAEPYKGFAEVNGRFPRAWKKARGTLEVQGDTSAGKDCQSGVVDWTAKRV